MRKTLSVAALLVLAGAGTASAHISVHGPEAAQGGFSKITFQVPTEKDIPTTKVEIDLPIDQPLVFVSIKPHAGWTVVATKTKLPKALEVEDLKIDEVVTKVVWTADAGQGIKPGQFDEFDISGGFLPKAESMTFKALQTYSDGTVVRWIEAPDAEHPAPVLKLAAAEAEESHHVDTTATAAPTATASAEPIASLTGVALENVSDSTGRALGGAGLGVGVLGLLLGAAAYKRARTR